MISADFRESIRSIYEDLARDIAEAGPVCDLSGRCCRFQEWDHTLFLSEIEARLLLAEAPPGCRPLDSGATCPWQDERGHCTAREGRPLGCRVYFCDPSYQEAGQRLSEVYLSRLKAATEAHGLLWSYAPLHHHLRSAVDRGEWVSPMPSACDSGPDGPTAGVDTVVPAVL
jgi:Fe-S-cluster containining protein